MKDFVMIPRQIHRDKIDGKLSLSEYFVLRYIIDVSNPVDGRCEVSYMELAEFFRPLISYDSARSIISSLRRNKYIWFVSHKGRGGKFAIYPCNFQLTNGKIQCYQDLVITTSTESLSQPKHNRGIQNHNLDEAKKRLVQGFAMDSPTPKITTPYTDTENDIETNNTIDKTGGQPRKPYGLEGLRKAVKELGVGH